MLQLNSSNYYSAEANWEYMSNSQYKDFRACEAMAMAKLGGWQEPPSDALLLGSYVHAYFEGAEAFESFKVATPELISSKGPTKGKLKCQYRDAEAMISALENDPLCMFLLQGQKEVIMSAEFTGTWWKIKMDNYAPDRLRFSDIKTVQNISKETWDPENGYVSFVEAQGYVTQMALYAEIERRKLGRDGWIEPYIVAVSKEDPPDKAAISINAYDIQRALDEIERHMPRILDVKSGRAEPQRCEKCRYCRETKVLKHIIHFSELVGR
ncbi:PD-(D/E)XK nuclease-like domain-containing protein [Paenibacillus melissococcoides]|uniref:PD-(D/E)XK nuclease-like domain-containing protein n=1 Tax=Paenibacillus melissococcoides TaxID=2912268 RepID=UPI0038B40DAD